MTTVRAGVVLIALLGLWGCGGSSNTTGTSGTTALTPASDAAIIEEPPAQTDSPYSGGEVSPVVASPQLGLRRWDGKQVRIGDYAGKVTLVTFLYTSCPDICPAIADRLVQVKRRLGKDGDRLALVVISVDPERDSPGAVRDFLRSHQALSKIDYLIGSRDELERTWSRWGVAARTSPDNPDLIDHSGLIWGVDPRGRRVTFYPASGIGVDEMTDDVRVMLKSTS